MRVTRGTKRTFELDGGVIATLDAWSARTGVAKNVAVELGVWIVTHIGAGNRELLQAAMRAGFGPMGEGAGSDFLHVVPVDGLPSEMRQRWEEIARAPVRDDLAAAAGLTAEDRALVDRVRRIVRDDDEQLTAEENAALDELVAFARRRKKGAGKSAG